MADQVDPLRTNQILIEPLSIAAEIPRRVCPSSSTATAPSPRGSEPVRSSASRATFSVVPEMRRCVAIERQMHGARGQALDLGLDGCPVGSGRNSRAHRDEIDPPHVRGCWQQVLVDEREERRPVDTRRAPPVPRPGLFMIGEVGMKGTQDLTHPPRLADRDVVVGVSVQDIDPARAKVSHQGERIAGIGRAATSCSSGLAFSARFAPA